MIVLLIALCILTPIAVYCTYCAIRDKDKLFIFIMVFSWALCSLSWVGVYHYYKKSLEPAPIVTGIVYTDTPDDDDIKIVPIIVGDTTIYVPVVVNDIDYD